MKKMYCILWAVCILFVTSAGALAQTAIDFEDMAEGTILTDQFSDLGIRFSYIGADGGPALKLLPDNYPGMGMVFNPTDGIRYYDVQIDFTHEIEYFSIRSADADEPMYLKAYLDDRLVADVYFPSIIQDLGIQTMVLEGIGPFSRVVVDIRNDLDSSAGPEFFDNIIFNPDAPAHRAIPMTFDNWDRLHNGEWSETEEGLKINAIGYRGRSRIKTKNVYDFTDSEVFMKWKADSRSYCAITFGVYPVNSNIFITTHHSYGGSTLIKNDTWYYSRIKTNPDKSYTIVTATGDYDVNGGKIIQNDSTTLSDADWAWVKKANIDMNLFDAYGAESASITVAEVRTDASPVEVKWSDSVLYDFENDTEIPDVFTYTGNWTIADTGFESSKSLHLSGSEMHSVFLDAKDVVQISFRVKHSQADFRDTLALLVDGKRILASSTVDMWSDRLTFVIPEGSQIIEFEAVEETQSSGVDINSTWLDDIEIMYGSRNSLTVRPTVTTAAPGDTIVLDIIAEAKDSIWAVEFKDFTENEMLSFLGGEYTDELFDPENLLRVPIQEGSGAVTHRYPAGEITGKGHIASLTYTVTEGCGEVMTGFDGSFYDMDGNEVKTDVFNTNIHVDDGIHCGSGMIQGTVTYPFGDDHSGIVVTIVLGEKTYSTVTDADGNFSFPNLRDGDFIIYADAPLYLSECSQVQVTGDQPVTVNLTMTNADINHDGEVGIGDFTLLAGAYETCEGDENY
ncbi:MAG: carboxypeptidase-like regulatory domain-containing protein, partial [Desulfococcaceae bacterium]|nr:carboxypeptidase-like regulatory domain-containing protein [Desulfococcaceae bacterium]